MVICCLGDSLTEGDYGRKGIRGIANVHEKNYPYFLSRLSGACVRNYGKCGYRASDFLNFYNSGGVDLTDAEYIIILLGTNGGMDPETETEDDLAYAQLIERCQKDAPAARVYICTPPHATCDPAMVNCGYAPQVEKATAFVRKLGRERQLPVIDLAACQAFSAETEAVMQPNDGLHFGEEGYKVMAHFIWQELKKDI